MPGGRGRPGLPRRVRRPADARPSRGTAPTSSTSPRSWAASSARAGERSSPTPGGCSSSRRSSVPRRRAGSSTTCALADDPQAPTTSSVAAPYPQRAGRPDPARRRPAGPRRRHCARHGGRRRVRRSAGPGDGVPGGPARRGPPMVVDGPFGPIDLGAVPDGMSNAALMGADRTADGHPQVVFGPQTGYFAPQLLTEQAVVAPGIRARGVSFAGTSLVVQLGHGVDYAWSATSAGSDLVDTVVVRLCEPGGGTATLESEGYLDGDSCVADGPGRARGGRDSRRRRPRPSRRRSASWCCAPSTASSSCARPSTARPSRWSPSGAPTAGNWTPRSGSSGSATPTTSRTRRASARPRRPSTTPSTGSTSTTATSPTTPPAGCRCAPTASTRTCPAGATRPTTGRAGWPPTATRSR